MGFDLIVANYNNGRYLDEFLLSIENSTIQPSKIIIVDDCSTDNSVLILRKWSSLSKLNIVLIENKQNLGFARSLNIAINQITSKYFARIDPDDTVIKQRFELQLIYLKKNPEIDLIGSNVTYFIKNKSISNSNVPLNSVKLKKEIEKGLIPIIHGSIMGKSEIFHSFRYKKELVPAEDYDLFAYLVKENYTIENLADSLTCVRIHANSVSNDLQFSTIMKRYNIRYNYFNLYTILTFRLLEYYHQWFYRKYLFSNSALKYFYLIISGICNPKKVINRIKKT